jgi:hypothetical protein
VEALQSRASSLLTPCLSQFAVAVADDALWKQLNYQILLKTRHNLPQVSALRFYTQHLARGCLLTAENMLNNCFLIVFPFFRL